MTGTSDRILPQHHVGAILHVGLFYPTFTHCIVSVLVTIDHYVSLLVPKDNLD